MANMEVYGACGIPNVGIRFLVYSYGGEAWSGRVMVYYSLWEPYS